MSKYDYLHELYQELKSVEPTKRKEIMSMVEYKFNENNSQDDEKVMAELGSPTVYASQFITTNHVNIVKTINTTERMNTALSDEQQEETNINSLNIDKTPDKLFSNPNPQTTEKKEYESIPPKQKPSSPTKNSNKGFTLLFILGGLGFMNLLLLGPFIAIWAVAFSFMISGIAISISSIFVIISGLITTPFSFISLPFTILSHPFLITASGFMFLGIGGLLTILTIYMIRFFSKLTTNYISWNFKTIRGY